MAKVTTLRSLERVSTALVNMAKGDNERGQRICEAFDLMLDELLEDDFFGTEGQLDPRGDHREDA